MTTHDTEARLALANAQLDAIRLIRQGLSNDNRRHVVMFSQSPNPAVTTSTLVAITTRILDTVFTDDQCDAILDAFAKRIEDQLAESETR